MAITLLHYGSVTHKAMVYWGYSLSNALDRDFRIFLFSRRYQEPFEKVTLSSAEAFETDDPDVIIKMVLDYAPEMKIKVYPIEESSRFMELWQKMKK